MSLFLLRLLVEAIGLVGYTALTVWMMVSIDKPASPDAIGVPLITVGLCLMCIYYPILVVCQWRRRDLQNSPNAGD